VTTLSGAARPAAAASDGRDGGALAAAAPAWEARGRGITGGKEEVARWLRLGPALMAIGEAPRDGDNCWRASWGRQWWWLGPAEIDDDPTKEEETGVPRVPRDGWAQRRPTVQAAAAENQSA
jgi:hypothetical protein